MIKRCRSVSLERPERVEVNRLRPRQPLVQIQSHAASTELLSFLSTIGSWFINQKTWNFLTRSQYCVCESSTKQYKGADTGTLKQNYTSLKPFSFLHKRNNSLFEQVQVIPRERGPASCLVWHMPAFVCRVVCRRRKFVFVQGVTQQQHSCDRQLRHY